MAYYMSNPSYKQNTVTHCSMTNVIFATCQNFKVAMQQMSMNIKTQIEARGLRREESSPPIGQQSIFVKVPEFWDSDLVWISCGTERAPSVER